MPNDSNCKDLYEYFERQWIKSIPPVNWSHFDSNIRTNNKLEGFYSGFNRLVSQNHPNVFLLVNFLKDIQCSTAVDYERLKQGQKFTIHRISK